MVIALRAFVVPFGLRVYQSTLIGIVGGLLALSFKGAIVRFYLRQVGQVGPNGAAYSNSAEVP